MIGRATTVLAYASLVVAGFVLGVAGSFLQAVTIQVGPVPVPIGLIGALAATGSVFFAGAWLDHRPIGVLLPALAWFLGVFPFTVERPEGDLVLSGDLRSYGYLVFGAVLAVLAAMYPGRRSPSGRTQSIRESPGGQGHETVGT
ncbi:MAG TPA: DUF6113 family protein [Actinomycetes bacterium]|nr:DUF6113 family protein [Actinomycetes bacterium]